MTKRTKPGLMATVLLLFVFLADRAYGAAKTVHQLDAIETERDRWQHVHWNRSQRSISHRARLSRTSVLAPYAVDIHRLPLMFLWARAVQRKQHNIHRIVARPDDPRIPPGGAAGELIANTFRELDHPDAMLDHVHRSLRSRGRLVIGHPLRTEHGTRTAAAVSRGLRRHEFDIVSADKQFMEQPDRGVWWMVVATK